MRQAYIGSYLLFIDRLWQTALLGSIIWDHISGLSRQLWT